MTASSSRSSDGHPHPPPLGTRDLRVADILSGFQQHAATDSGERLRHHQWAAILLTRGGYRVGLDPKHGFDAGGGDLILMRPETVHAWRIPPHPLGRREGLAAYFALFQPPAKLEALLDYPEIRRNYSLLHIHERAVFRRIVACFRAMNAIGNSRLPHRAQLQFNLLEQALLWCAGDQQARFDTTDPRIARVIEFMAGRLAEPLAVKDFCAVARMSRSQFTVVFQRETGTKPMRYLERLRIERAVQMLRLSKQRLDTVAAAVGFCDTKHFCRTFKRIVGRTAGDYRRSVRG
jgi:AraC-like DNA-binding protein